MEITNNMSPSFGSIQVGVSRMTPKQKIISERLFNTLKYNEKYSKMSNNDLDIYMTADSKKGINIRYMDPYSGSFIRDEQGKIIKEKLGSTVSEKLEAVADAVVNTYEKIINGIIPRPKENPSKVIAGKTEMVRVNPAKQEDFSESIRDWKRLGYTQEEAEMAAFDDYKELYHVKNKDADF